ncbi:MAG: AMP-binding protein [Acidobacteria bacterium]|nr:AMP-binding protein [Acidobacteriota bacterium]
MKTTVPSLFSEIARRRGDAPALCAKRDGEWRQTSWREFEELVRRAARGFMELGHRPGQAIAILGFNRPEWVISDIAAITAGGTPAGIYTTSTAEQCHYITEHSEAAVAVVENSEQLEKFLAIRDRLPALRGIVLMEGDSDAPGVLSWGELLALGDTVAESRLADRITAQKPDDLATLIYTSGTTGPPKAVMLSHHNLIWTAEAMVDAFSINQDDQFFSYLPLSHIAEQMVSLHSPMRVGACTWFAESLEKLPENLREVRPHIFFGVPRVWEKFQAAIAAAGAESKGLKRKITVWARSKGLVGGYAAQRGDKLPTLYGLAEKLVFSKVRAKLGLDRARICACSAAPITLDTLEFFLSLGIPILEVYGMSEATGPGTLSRPDKFRTGRAGFAFPGVEIEIAADGEILMRGPHVFLGYYKDEAATRETLDENGWIHSGDIGDIDQDGFVKVTDRKKELIITSGGENIAPAPIEAQLKSIPCVAAALVIGDHRNYLTALLTFDSDRLRPALEAAGSAAQDIAAAVQCALFTRWLEEQVEKTVNATLSRVQTIKKVCLLAEQFTIEGGELTPTMKLKRRVVLSKYEREIEALYS